MKNREIVTRIKNDLNAISKDAQVSSRWIIFTARQIATAYIAQKLGEGLLFREDNLYTTVRCVPMIKVRSIDCCVVEFRLCETLMRSKERIPGVLFYRNGAAIDMVTSVDNGIVFDSMNLRSYTNEKKRKYFSQLNVHRYYYDDGYIWIPDEQIELVNIRLITLEKKKALKLSTCKDTETENPCESELDSDFICPDKLLEYVMKATLQESLQRVQIPSDAVPNLNENEKTQS